MSDEVSQTVDIGIDERSQPKEDIGVIRVLLIAHREYCNKQTNNQIIIHLILTYYFSELNYISCVYFIHGTI